MIKEYIKRKQDYEKYWTRNIVITDDDIYVSNVLSGDMERRSVVNAEPASYTGESEYIIKPVSKSETHYLARMNQYEFTDCIIHRRHWIHKTRFKNTLHSNHLKDWNRACIIHRRVWIHYKISLQIIDLHCLKRSN